MTLLVNFPSPLKSSPTQSHKHGRPQTLLYDNLNRHGHIERNKGHCEIKGKCNGIVQTCDSWLKGTERGAWSGARDSAAGATPQEGPLMIVFKINKYLNERLSAHTQVVYGWPWLWLDNLYDVVALEVETEYMFIFFPSESFLNYFIIHIYIAFTLISIRPKYDIGVNSNPSQRGVKNTLKLKRYQNYAANSRRTIK